MQEQFAAAQEELAGKTYEGTAGGGDGWSWVAANLDMLAEYQGPPTLL